MYKGKEITKPTDMFSQRVGSYDLVAAAITNEVLCVVGRLSSPTRDQIITAFAVIGIEFRKMNRQTSSELSVSAEFELADVAVRVLAMDSVFPELHSIDKWNVVCLKWMACIAEPYTTFSKVVVKMRSILHDIVNVSTIGSLARRRGVCSLLLSPLDVPPSSLIHSDGSECTGTVCSCDENSKACVCDAPSFREADGEFVCLNSLCGRKCHCSPSDFDSCTFECTRCGVKYISGP
jgi:hypothetical protein